MSLRNLRSGDTTLSSTSKGSVVTNASGQAPIGTGWLETTESSYYVDIDPTVDSSGDGDPTNDEDVLLPNKAQRSLLELAAAMRSSVCPAVGTLSSARMARLSWLP